MKKAIFIILLLTFCALQKSDCKAQQPAKAKFVWQWSDTAVVAAMAADEVSTHVALNRCPTCYEAGLVKNTGARIALKAVVLLPFKLYEWRHPDSRSKTRWIKFGIAGVFGLVAARNFRQR